MRRAAALTVRHHNMLGMTAVVLGWRLRAGWGTSTSRFLRREVRATFPGANVVVTDPR
jgi:hypothetical protein